MSTVTQKDHHVLSFLETLATEHRQEAKVCRGKATQASLLGNSTSTVNRLQAQAEEHSRKAGLYTEAVEAITRGFSCSCHSSKDFEEKFTNVIHFGGMDMHEFRGVSQVAARKALTQNYPLFPMNFVK
jgi:hypothetical protein